jgi:Flp pilus assembly protein TadG
LPAPNRENGAVLVIVTLSLLAMFGMMVLVVDVGSLLYARRALVNASDAAALAAAQSCGQKEGSSEATAQAEFYAVQNQSGAALDGSPVFEPSCDAPSGTVTVRVTTQRPMFFAPVLGADAEKPVTTEATAMWGGAGAGEVVAPLMLSAGRLNNCDIPPPQGDVEPHECAFWWNNSNSANATDLANAEWGTLDLDPETWDVPISDPCNGTPNMNDFRTWLTDGVEGPLPITPPTTYVCKGVGNGGGALNNLIDMHQGDSLFFPVNDPQTQADTGFLCPPPPPGEHLDCHVNKYNIIGFAKLTIIELIPGRDLRTMDPSTRPCNWIVDPAADGRCMLTLWTEYTPEGINPDGGENFGLVPVRLVE